MSAQVRLALTMLRWALARKGSARGRTRTDMGLPPRDFKSHASTSFATRAGERNLRTEWG